MSYNSLIQKKDSAKISVLNRVLNESLSRYNSFSFLTDFNNFNNELLSYEDLLLNLKTDKRNYFHQLDYNIENKASTLHNILYGELFTRLDDLIKHHKIYKNILYTKKLSIQSKSKEIKQKLESLDSFTLLKKFSFKENFENMYYILFSRLNKPSLTIDPVASVATLPITNTETIQINKVYIEASSTGIPGNFYNGNNKFVYNILNEQDDNGFEYFKIGSGPLKLVLMIDFYQSEIINEIDIVRNIGFASSNLNIESVSFFNNNKTVKLLSLINTRYQPLSFENQTDKNQLHIKHLPVKAQRVKITLSTDEYTLLNNTKLYSMFLRTIKFKKNIYATEGEVESTSISLPPGLFLMNCKMNSFPRKNSSIDFSLGLSVDSGATYKELVLNDNNLTESIFLNNQSADISYKLSLAKNNNVLEILNPYENESFFLEPKTIQKIFNRNISPNYFAFTKNIKDNSLKVFQPNLAVRSSLLEEMVVLGSTNNTGISFFTLPVNLHSLSINKEDLQVYKNNQLLSNVSTQEELTDNTYYIDNNSKDIYIHNSSTNNVEIGFLLKPISPQVIQESEGYYIAINESFDYDKKNIVINNHVYKKEIVKEFLQINNNIHFLNNAYIKKDTFVLQQQYQDAGWVTISPDNYTLDEYSGTLYYNPTTETKVHYNYYNVKRIDNFEIWSNENKVKGLYISSDDVSFLDINEKLNNDNVRKNLYITLRYIEFSQRSRNPNPLRTFVLSNPNIIKNSLLIDQNLFGENETFQEISYVDGYTEFLGLKHFEKDFIPSIEVNTNRQITFVLSQKPYLRENLTIKLFNNNYIELQDFIYSISSNIITIIFTTDDYNSSVLKDFYISYWYQSSNFKDYNTYSVNYKEGIVYTSKDINNSESLDISYSIGAISLSYHIVNEIEDYELNLKNKNISLYTESLSKQNNLIKFIYFDNQLNDSVKDLKDYFSPIVYSLEVSGK